MDSVLDGFERAFVLSFATYGGSNVLEFENTAGNRFSVRVNGMPEVFSIGSYSFTATGNPSNVVLVALADLQNITHIRILGFGPTVTTGTPGSNINDFSNFPSLNTFVFQPQTPSLIVKSNSVFASGNGAGTIFDASRVDCLIFGSQGNLVGLIFPPAARLQRVNLDNCRFANFVVPANYAALTEIFLGDGANSGSGSATVITTIDAAGATNLARLVANDTGTLTFILPTAFAAKCLTLDASRCRLGNTVFGGSFETVRAMLAANTLATTLRFRQAGLSGAEQTALITAVWANRAARPQTGTRVLHLDGNAVALCYPQLTGGPSGPIFNAGIVDSATRAKVADLRALGWTVLHNAPTMRIATSATAGQLTLTYEGDLNIDIWTAGNVITQTVAQAGGFLATGNYTVVSGAGKVWEITGSFAVAPGATVVRGTFDK